MGRTMMAFDSSDGFVPRATSDGGNGRREYNRGNPWRTAPMTEKELSKLERKHRITSLKLDGHLFTLLDDRIKMDNERQPLDDVEIRLETGDEVKSRFTVTRIVLFGPFAALAPKKSKTQYLTIEGPDFFWSAEVRSKEYKEAQRFVAAVKNQVKKNGRSAS